MASSFVFETRDSTVNCSLQGESNLYDNFIHSALIHVVLSIIFVENYVILLYIIEKSE